jgi:type VI secretion system protein VasD
MTGKRTPFILRIALVAALSILLLEGCGSDPEKEKPEPAAKKPEKTEPKLRQVQLEISVSNEVNPDVDGRPSPIVLRIYELKNLGKFEVGDFFKLFDEYDAFLGADLVASEQFHLQPGDKKTVKHALSEETHYIAAAAAYRDLNKAVWRDSKPLKAKPVTEVEVLLGPLSISIK